MKKSFNMNICKNSTLMNNLRLLKINKIINISVKQMMTNISQRRKGKLK